VACSSTAQHSTAQHSNQEQVYSSSTAAERHEYCKLCCPIRRRREDTGRDYRPVLRHYKSPPFHSVIRIHLISFSYYILVILPSHFSPMEQMLMLMLLEVRSTRTECLQVCILPYSGLKQICSSLSSDMARTVASALLNSCLTYTNSVMYGTRAANIIISTNACA